MIINKVPDGNIHVYMLSVGQADSTIIVSPKGNVMVIDAIRPLKVLDLLDKIGNDKNIEHLVITHPHNDHFGGCNRLAENLTILEATVAPFWHEFGMGPPTYRQLLKRLDDQKSNITFLSGYSRWYPDDIMTTPLEGQYPEVNEGGPYLELLGPTNGLVNMLEQANTFQPNHLSIMIRLTWNDYRFLIAGDAQMENWAFFDQERLLEKSCRIMRAAHHGSGNGTQWERIDRINPKVLIVSSDPNGKDNLPDLCGAAAFAKFDSDEDRIAVLTIDSGSIHLTITPGGDYSMEMYNDRPGENIEFSRSVLLTKMSNPTDWRNLLLDRANAL